AQEASHFALAQSASTRQAPRQQKLLYFLDPQQRRQRGTLHGGVVAGRAVRAQGIALGLSHQHAHPLGQARQQLGQVLFGDDEGHEIVDFGVAAQLVFDALQGVAVALHLVAVHKGVGDVHHVGAGSAGGQLVDSHAALQQRVKPGADFGVVHE
nr:hypothetical protein [Tanacetum cinerariifolium]